MEQAEKIQALNDRLARNAEKIEQAKERLAALEAERKNIEYSRMQAIIGDYLPILEELQLTPGELRELLAGNNSGTVTATTYGSEDIDDEE